MSYEKTEGAIARLTPEQFRVTQQNGTERPWSGELTSNKGARETRPREELYDVYSRYYEVYAGLYSDLAERYAQLWRAGQ